jgi:CubicO group peptidase (beta-lactamase class C family)
MLFIGTGVLSGRPGFGQPPEDGSTPAATEPGCGLAVARLHQGQLVEQPESESCSLYKGSTPVFQAASLAKPIVATLVLKLVLRKQLSLDQPVAAFLPDGYAHRQNLFALREPPEIDVVPSEVLGKLTVRHLLSHTGGLPNWSDRGPLRLEAEPGARWRYSGEGYVLLQHILESRTGLPLDKLASSELFEPLGLRHVAFKLRERIAPSLVPGRTAAGQVRQLRFPYEIGAGSLYTSAPDYARFIGATLSDPQLMSLIMSSLVSVPNSAGVFWGLGWGIQQSNGGTAIWHWGNNPGFRALAMADLKSKNAAVVLTASENGMPQAKAIVQRLLPGTHPAFALNLVR